MSPNTQAMITEAFATDVYVQNQMDVQHTPLYDEPRPPERRLLSPEQAAAYLGLRSRFAIYRLVAGGRLRALRLSNKLRLDLRDLDSMIEEAKAEGTGSVDRSPAGPASARLVPRQLAPHRRRRSATPRVTVQARPD